MEFIAAPFDRLYWDQRGFDESGLKRGSDEASIYPIAAPCKDTACTETSKHGRSFKSSAFNC